ncbi:hypothetical protein FA413_16710 [Pseudomonas aeruginosa]|nr:hypothetical protein [Pseudomonas aeruginosa]MCO2072495.1 hypothetical protein [Pseudomonas aeruginosa]
MRARSPGLAWPGLAWPGLAWPGLAWQDVYPARLFQPGGISAGDCRRLPHMCASAYSASTERGTPCRVTCTPWGKSLKRSVR